MATKKTKTLAAVTTVTTVNTSQYIPLTDGSGNVTKVTLANLKAALLFATTPDGSSIYWNDLMNETEIGRHKRTLFTFVGNMKNGSSENVWVETTIGQCGN